MLCVLPNAMRCLADHNYEWRAVTWSHRAGNVIVWNLHVEEASDCDRASIDCTIPLYVLKIALVDGIPEIRRVRRGVRHRGAVAACGDQTGTSYMDGGIGVTRSVRGPNRHISRGIGWRSVVPVGGQCVVSQMSVGQGVSACCRPIAGSPADKRNARSLGEDNLASSSR